MSAQPTSSPAVERVLIVCTGNICRSPYAAYSLQAMLTHRGVTGISVDSAGARAQAGHTMAPRIAAALAHSGIESRDFQSKPLTQHLVERADLVLTAEAAHRSAVVRLDPSALGRVFTLRQFARLIPAAATSMPNPPEPGGLQALVKACSAARGVGQPARGAEDDIEDPWGRSRRAYRHSIKSIDSAIGVIAEGIVAATRGSH